MIRALDNIDPTLGAFVTVEPDLAIQKAAGAVEGPLTGITLAVKDLIDVKGLRATYGSPKYSEHFPGVTAPAVSALERRGAAVVGKTNLNEFAFGVTGYNPHFGAILTPADRRRTAGGSSGGSAVAAATGACRVAVGTDTSGSVRIPAACCGIWGIKLAHGRDLRGIFPLAPSLDSLGYLAKDPADLELVLGISALPEPQTVRVGRIGEDLTAPPLPPEHWVIFREESWSVHGPAYSQDPSQFGLDLRRKLSLPRGDVLAAAQTMSAWRDEYQRAVASFDVIVQPVFDGPAPLLEDVEREYLHGGLSESNRLMARTPTANALGWPALVFPGAEGPLEALARPGRESSIFSVARALAAN
jgi:aspartyl-tRNA(Asn)/glutamyl-tRNA(Gln) amidotransferase subunit A